MVEHSLQEAANSGLTVQCSAVSPSRFLAKQKHLQALWKKRNDSVQVATVAGALVIQIQSLSPKPPPPTPRRPGERRVAPKIPCERCVANFIMLPIQRFDGAGSSGRLAAWPERGMRGDEVTREGKKQDGGDVLRGQGEAGVAAAADEGARSYNQRTEQSAGCRTHKHVHKFHPPPCFFSRQTNELGRLS